MDKRKNNSGTKGNKGGGRKSKSNELKLVESLDKIISHNAVIEKLKELIEDGNITAIKIYFERRFGSVSKEIELVNAEQPLFSLIPNIVYTTTEEQNNLNVFDTLNQ